MVTVYTLCTFPESLPHAIGWITVLLLQFPLFDCFFLSTSRLRNILLPLKQKKNTITPLLGIYKLTNPNHKWPLSNHSLWWNERCNCLEGKNMGSMLAWGSKVITCKGPFLSGTAPFVQHSLAAIFLHFGYLPMQLVLCLVQTTKRHSATSSSAWGRFSQMTKKDGLYILPSLPIKRTLKLHYYKLLLIMQQSLELQELSGEDGWAICWGERKQGRGDGWEGVAWDQNWWQGKMTHLPQKTEVA